MPVTVCRSLAELRPHIGAWDALAREAASGTAAGDWFAGPGWILPLLQTWFADRALAVMFVYDRELLTGVLPLVAGATHGTACAPDWSLPINTHVRRIGMLARHSFDDTVGTILGTPHLFADPREARRCLAMRQIPRDGALAHSLQTAARRHALSVHRVDESRSAVVDIPDGWDAYAATRTGEQLHPLRKRKRMDKAGGWSFQLADTDAGTAAFDTAWSQLLHVERHSWKQSAGTSIDNEPGAEAFYRAVSHTHAASGALRLHLLAHRGVPVAHTLGVVHGATYYLLKHSFDEAHRQLSPGFQLLWHVMQESVAAGCTRIDFLGDAMSWKVSLATSLPEYSSYMLFPRRHVRCQRCRLTNAVLKPVARKFGVKRLLRLARGNAG